MCISFVEVQGHDVLLYDFCFTQHRPIAVRRYSGYFNLPRFCEPIPRPLQKSTSNLEWSFLFPFYTFYHITILSLKYRRQCYWFVFILIFSCSRVMKTITLNASANICPYLLLKEIVTIEPVMNYISV